MKLLNRRIMRLFKSMIGQSLAVALVVAIGLMFYVAMTAAIENLDETVKDYDRLTHAPDLYLEFSRIDRSRVDDLMRQPGVQLAQGRIVEDATMKTDNGEKVTLRVVSLPEKGTGTDWVQLHSLYFNSGKPIQNIATEACLIESLGKARNILTGQKVSVQINGSMYTFSISGMVSSSEYVYLMESEQSLLPDFKKFGILYLAEPMAMKAMGMNGLYNQVLIKVKTGYSVEEVRSQLEKELKGQGLKRIYTHDDQISNRVVQEKIKGGKKASSTVPFAFLMIAAAIMYAMVNRMVKTDRLAIGILKSMGYDNQSILLHYCFFTNVIGVTGALLGVLSGSALSALITQIYANQSFNLPILTFKFYYNTLFASLALAMLFSFVAGLTGAKDVLKMDPAVAMRPEVPRSGKSILVEKTPLWKQLTFSEKMVVRNLFRSKKRVILIALGIAASFSLVLIPIFEAKAFIDLFKFQYDVFYRMSYTVNFKSLVSDRAVFDVGKISDAKFAEGKLEYPFDIRKGWNKRVTSVVGFPVETQLLHFYDVVSGKAIQPQKGHVYISEGLAKALDAKAGDMILLKSFVPGREDRWIRVNAVIKQNLGTNLYMDITLMQKLFFSSGAINGVWLKTDANVKSILGDEKNISAIQSMEDIRNVYKQFLDMLNVSIGMTVLFGGVLSVAVVYNSIIMMVNERKTEFASMMVMGLSGVEIFLLLVREILTIGVVGVLLGIPLGRWFIQSMASAFSTDLYILDPTLTPVTYLQTAALMMAFVLLSLVLAFTKITRIDFIEALKNRVT